MKWMKWKSMSVETRMKAMWLMAAAVVYHALVFSLMIEVNFLGYFGQMPDWDDLENPKHELASEVYSADGVLLGKYYICDILYDANDEVEAYNLQFLLTGDSTPFTILEIQNLRRNGNLIYPNIIVQDRNTTTVTSGSLIRDFYIRP